MKITAAEIMRRVKIIADYCRTSDFTPQGLLEAIEKTKPAIPRKPRKMV